MAWIDTRPRPGDEGRLAELFAKAADPRSGRVDHILQVHALHPDGLRAHLELYTAVMRPTPGLDRADREMIAVVVSASNRCHY